MIADIKTQLNGSYEGQLQTLNDKPKNVNGVKTLILLSIILGLLIGKVWIS